MDPLTLAGAAIGSGAATSALGAYTQTQAAKAQEKELGLQESRIEAQASERRRQREERLRRVLASQRAVFGASGQDVAFGSAAAVQADTVEQAYAEIAADERIANIDRAMVQGRRATVAYNRRLIPVQAGLGFANQSLGAAFTMSSLTTPTAADPAGGTRKGG